MSEQSKEIRLSFGHADCIRDEGLVTPDNILRFDDLQYGTDEIQQLLDIYRPADKKDKLPVIVSVHGGAWVYGDKDVYQYYCMSLAKHGFAIVNFSYRLAPEHKFPAALEDANMVFCWVKENAEQYGFDLSRIFAVGDSAGAHLLALYCNLCKNKDYRERIGFSKKTGCYPKAIALNCGVYDPQKGDVFLRKIILEDLMPEQWKDTMEPMNILDYLTPEFPPCFIMTCEGDFLKEQPQYLIPRLEEEGVSYKLKIYGDKKMPLSHVFHCDIRSPQATTCNREECEFFLRFC